MGIEYKILERLSNLELQYLRNLTALKNKDKDLFYRLLKLPVNVKMIVERGICEDLFYDVCSSLQEKYERFVDVRNRLREIYIKISSLQKVQDTGKENTPCLLSVLFDGIYIGYPKDLFNYRNNNQLIEYPTKGLGNKIAEIEISSNKF